jgi:hypothetical protein
LAVFEAVEDLRDIRVEGDGFIVSIVSDGRIGGDLSRTVLSLGDALRGGVMWVSIQSGHLLSVERRLRVQCVVKVEDDEFWKRGCF